MATRKQVQHYLRLLREVQATQRISVLQGPATQRISVLQGPATQRISVQQGRPSPCTQCSEATDERHFATCDWLAEQYAFDQYARQS